MKALKVTLPELREVVATNNKQRFSMIPATTLNNDSQSTTSPQELQDPEDNRPAIFDSDDPADYLIRANQGHSIKIDTEGLLTPITEDAANIPDTVVHGTDYAAWKLILKSGGMRAMGRNHMHFASGLPEGFKSQTVDGATESEKNASPVISGMRKGSTVLIYIDIRAAMQAGIAFFVSENGVILTSGNETGLLPYEFFKRVEARGKDGSVLMSEGVLPDGVVVDVEGWEREVGSMGGKGKRGGRGGRGGKRGGGAGKARVNDDSRDLLADV